MDVQPIEDRILVKREDHSYQTDSGLYLPEGAEDRQYPEVGSVIAVGPGKAISEGRVPMDVAVGDRIIFSRYAGTEVTIDGTEYVMLQQFEVLAQADPEAKVEWSHSL